MENRGVTAAELKLKAAISILDEMAEQTSEIEKTMDDYADLAGISLDSLASGIAKASALKGEVSELNKEIDQAINLAEEARRIDPEVSITEDDTEITPDIVIYGCYFQKGLLFIQKGFLSYWSSISAVRSRYKCYNDARNYFKRAFELIQTPEALLFLANTLCYQGYYEESLTAFQQVIDMFPNTEEAISATKMLAKISQAKLKKRSTALVLSIFFGFLGVDRFYLGYKGLGFLKLIFALIFPIWWLLDIIFIATNSIQDSKGMALAK